MTLKVEVANIPNTNLSNVLSYEESKINGKTNRINQRHFVVPQNKTDEFIARYKKQQNTTLKASVISGLIGFLSSIGLTFWLIKPKWDLIDNPIFYIGGAGFTLGAGIPMLINKLKEKRILQDCKASEVKLKKK